MRTDTVSHESAEGTETGPDDTLIAAINYIPNRRLIIAAGKLAKAEQERLERELGLQDGCRRPKRTPGGYFPLTKGRGGLQEPSPRTCAPPPF
jgi:hypothetical protein